MNDAAILESEFHLLNHDLPGYEDFELALALYEPGGKGDLVGEDGLRKAAIELLHDLDDHSLCLHHLPLWERP